MIENINSIDLLGERIDGGVDLSIVSVGGLDDSVETQTALMDKIENYLNYINSKDFIETYGVLAKDKINIILKIDEPLSPVGEQLFSGIAKWVDECNATIRLELVAS